MHTLIEERERLPQMSETNLVSAANVVVLGIGVTGKLSGVWPTFEKDLDAVKKVLRMRGDLEKKKAEMESVLGDDERSALIKEMARLTKKLSNPSQLQVCFDYFVTLHDNLVESAQSGTLKTSRWSLAHFCKLVRLEEKQVKHWLARAADVARYLGVSCEVLHDYGLSGRNILGISVDPITDGRIDAIRVGRVGKTDPLVLGEAFTKEIKALNA